MKSARENLSLPSVRFPIAAMALLRIMLVLSAIAMSVVSFPSAKNAEEMELHAEKMMVPNLQHALQTVALLKESSDSKLKSSIVEFVKKSHEENSTVEQGTDNEKYTITNISAKKNDSKDNETEHLTLKDISDVENFNIKNIENLNFPSTLEKEKNSGIFTFEDMWSLSPKEPSVITEGIPKYLFGIIQSEPLFTDMSRGPNRKDNTNLEVKKSENVKPFLMPKKVQQYSVGPELFPQSIYNREFVIPFFE